MVQNGATKELLCHSDNLVFNELQTSLRTDNNTDLQGLSDHWRYSHRYDENTGKQARHAP